MITKDNHIINKDTVAIIGEKDQNDNLYSIVLEGNNTFVVNMSPVSLIENSLLFYCSSLQGATEGSRSILGNVSMLPVTMYAPLEIYWFPCSSPYRSDCIWIALIHVINCEKINSKDTKVNLNFGQTLVLDMKIERFETKLQRASRLRYTNIERTRRQVTYFYEYKKGVQFVKQSRTIKYRHDKDITE